MPSDAEQKRLSRLLELERQAQDLGYKRVAGVDEAGRGPLAGPVVAGACVLPKKFSIAGIDDSKKLTPQKREDLFEKLTASPDVAFATAQCDHARIDQINILQATLEAMRQAVARLRPQPDFLLIDGNQFRRGSIPVQLVPKGDQLSLSIAAASIIAKVLRDRIMTRYHEIYPQYGFAKHKGYPTRDHFDALRRHGPCPIHRRSFRLAL